MWATILIGAAIAVYAAWIIWRKIKKWRAGKFCDCGCGECPSRVKCHKDQIE